ncbi:MAG: hypothetical protein EOO92_12170 [Pedobacter sp.]|nr:MAG: hypothetical protein EOO92_12170 [Pedobacter sp.]
MNKILTLFSAVLLAGTLASCSKDEPPLPDNLINFSADKQGLESTAAEAEVKLSVSRPVDAATPLTITFTTVGVTYGSDFTTDPAATNSSLTVTIPAGGTSASFKVKKAANVVLNGSEKLSFTLTSAGQALVLGSTVKAELSFAAITSDGSTLTLNGIISSEAGSSAGNSVYVDFSGNSQNSIDRDSWDLGFYSGADYKVILNSSNGSSSIKVDKTDLNAVTSSDFNADALKMGGGEGTLSLLDDPREANILNKTAIEVVSAVDSENKVFIVNRKGGSSPATVAAASDLYKIRILRKGTTGYTLQYAKVTETTFKTIEITKDNNFNFQFVSLVSGGLKTVEPAKAKWDMVWGWNMYFTNFGAGLIPYGFSDLVFINNVGGVTAAEVLTSTVTYANYAEANIATTTFLNKRDVIGSNWRATTGTIGVKTDRFYVVKDGSGNVYKLKFNSFHASDGGTRGKPVIEYKLVKKG